MVSVTAAALNAVARVSVEYAAFEADSQLAYLCTAGRADVIVTEDSDVLVYTAVAAQAAEYRARGAGIAARQPATTDCDVPTMGAVQAWCDITGRS